jgi:hypothetical protein
MHTDVSAITRYLDVSVGYGNSIDFYIFCMFTVHVYPRMSFDDVEISHVML